MVTASVDERIYWVLLTMVKQIGPARFNRLLERFGSAEAAWNAPMLELAAAGLERRAVESLGTLRGTVDPEIEWQRIQKAGVSVTILDDPAYPGALREIADPPPVLYVRGDLSPADDWAIAVVGTRRATVYGRQVTERIVSEVARAGVTIVSGLARGIDTYAHRAALAAGGRTLAVLGSGLDRVYPEENRALADQIAKSGAILTEFPLGTPPDATNFPRRNRIVSGLARATLVVEADLKSGATNTTNHAAAQGRDVFAVPGSILSPFSSLPNQLIREGARVVTDASDILEELHLTAVVEERAAREALPADPTEAALLQLLSDEPTHVDDLTRGSKLPSATVSATLTILELKGLARQLGSMQYVRA
ncbi:MAG TPA: DNA-processing protein DprA [Chloroflexota bacterium]|nr:DNA-processing protein DprA [Chloroflexota bacterium]